MERRLHGLEQVERFEDAYALRMEMAEWLLQIDTDPPASTSPSPACSATVALTPSPRCPSRDERTSDTGPISFWTSMTIALLLALVGSLVLMSVIVKRLQGAP